MRTPVSSRPSSDRPSPTRRSHLLVRVATVLLLALGMLPAFTGQPAAAANSSLTINSHSCPYGTDLTTLNYYDLAAACQGQPALDYTINGPNYAQQVSAGLSTSSGLEPGVYAVTQGDYSATYGPPVAYCNVDDELGGDVTVGVVTSVVSGSQGPIDLAVDGYNAFCDVFNAELTPPPPPTSGEAEVFISKWACPANYTSNAYDDLQADCATEQEGVTFTITDFADDAVSDDTGGQPARASFTGWKTGGATITETYPQGYGEAVVYCYAEDDFGTVFPGYELTSYAVSGGTITIDIPVDPNGGISSFFCDWYDYPTTGYTDDAEVFISKWECPAGHVGDTYDSLQGDCDRELEGIDFTITHESGESATDDTGGQPARAAFTPWYNGSSTITESIPDGYGIPVVYCRATDDFNDPLPGYELTSYPVTDGSIDVVIPDAAPNTIVSFFCDWYNTVTTPTYGGIYLHKYGCPQGYSIDSSVEELVGGCYTIVRGAEFAVSGPGGYADSQALYDVDLAWENLEAGDYTVTESVPSGYRDHKVYCAHGAYDGGPAADYEPVNLTDDAIDVSLEGGAYVDCIWYNIPPPPPSGGNTTPTTTQPAGPATLVIVKSTCEADYDAYAAKADPTEDCDETTDGVSFTLRGGRDSSLTKVTGEDDDPGAATFSGLPAGSYLLQETYPDGVASAFVWECSSTVRSWVYAFAPFAVVGPDGQTKVNVVPGETLTCTWYDVLGPEDQPSGDDNVEVAVLDCPGDLVNEASCEPAAQGVAVDLTAAGNDGEDAALETDGDGVAAGVVEPGGYDLEVEDGICFADSDAFADDGTLDVGDDPVAVTVYRCDE